MYIILSFVYFVNIMFNMNLGPQTVVYRLVQQLQGDSTTFAISRLPYQRDCWFLVAECRLKPKDCSEVLFFNREAKSGVYTIYPTDDRIPYKAYCDMDTDCGGWTVRIIKSLYFILILQWRSSAPKSGGGGHKLFSKKSEKQKKKKKKKVTAAFKRMIGYCE